MDRSARNLLVSLLLVIILVGWGSAAFVIGLKMGSEGLAPPITAQPNLGAPTPAPALQTAAPTPTPDGDIRPELEILREAYGLIQSEYYGDIPDDTQLAYGAVRGMLQRLGDEHTTFLEPALAQRERETRSGSYSGIGAFVDVSGNQALEIIRVIRGSPAEAEGMRAGDVVIAVDGRSLIGLSLDEMVALVKGPPGSEVTLTIERAGVDQPFDVRIIRAQIEIPLVEARMIGSDIAYVSLSTFDALAADQLNRELDALLARNPQGMIFDLRGDVGGLLDQAINVADLFLGEGLIMTERTRDGSERAYHSDGGDPAETIPLAVLVDGSSASASEIVAGAIQDRARGVLIGTLTFGKGSVQRVHSLSDGSELRVTIARWFTPNDRAIHGEGLAPDIVVEAGEDPAQDMQLDRAVEYLRTGQ